MNDKLQYKKGFKQDRDDVVSRVANYCRYITIPIFYTTP